MALIIKFFSFSFCKKNSVSLKKSTSPKSPVSPEVISPFKLEVEPIVPVNEERQKLSFVMPTLFALLTMISSIIFASAFAMYDRKLSASARNFLSPTNKSVFAVSMLLATTTATFAQSLIFFAGLVLLKLKGMVESALKD